MRWEVEYTDEFEVWWDQLSEDNHERIRAAVEILEEVGPSLGRPLVDSLEGSKLGNMKELRPRGAISACYRIRHLAQLREEGELPG